MVATDAMTPTAELADIVVPKTTGLEEDEIRLQPGGPLIAMTQAVVPPQGEARNDFAIARGLLKKMLARGAATANFLPWQSQDEFIEFLLGDSGVTLGDAAPRRVRHVSLRAGKFREISLLDRQDRALFRGDCVGRRRPAAEFR